jgi:diguanylate cyclase (GGDEF)-like protein
MDPEHSTTGPSASVRALLHAESGRRGPFMRFSDRLEERFLAYYGERTRSQMRVALVLGAFLYGMFGILDAWIIPNARDLAWVIRYAIVIPMIAVVVLQTYLHSSDTRNQIGWTAVVLASGLGIVVMLAAATSDTANRYYSGVILVIFYAYVFSRMRFWYATGSSICVTLCYLAVSAWVKHASLPILINDFFFLVSTNIVGIPGCYLQEQYLRRDFLQTEMLRVEREDLRMANDGLREMSMVDELTRIGNRRRLESAFAREWLGAQRERCFLSFLMADVDWFKQFNDRYGHRAGDECLARIAGVMKQFARRPGDLAIRYGGEEFSIILLGARPADAARRGEELRKAVEALQIPHVGSPFGVVTVSVGLASMIPAPDLDRKELIEAADAALYDAKRGGRNRLSRYAGAPEDGASEAAT